MALPAVKMGKYWGDPTLGNGGWGCGGDCNYKCGIQGNTKAACDDWCAAICSIRRGSNQGGITAGTYNMIPKQVGLSGTLSKSDGCYANTGDNALSCYWCYMKGRQDVDSPEARQFWVHCSQKQGLVSGKSGGVGTPTAMTTTKKTAVGELPHVAEVVLDKAYVTAPLGAGIGFAITKDMNGVIIGALAGALATYYMKSQSYKTFVENTHNSFQTK